jgi:ABC-type branched-subunit amino acid transport system substrate-binding protein
MERLLGKALRVLLLSMLTVGLLLTAGHNQSSAADAIKVGFLAPLSGPLSAIGEEEVTGAQLAIKEINEAGGFLGQPVELVIIDSKAYVDEHPAEAVDQFVLKDKVLFIAGGVSDSIGWAVRERAAYHKTPYLGWVPWDSMSTRGDSIYPLHWVTGPDTETLQWCIWPYLLSNNLVPKDVVILGPDYEWGWANAKAARKPIEAFGGRVVKEIFTPVPTLKFDTFIAQIQDLMPNGGTITANNGGGEMLETFHEIYAAGLLDKGYAFVKNNVYGPASYGAIPQEELEGVWALNEYYPHKPGDKTHLKWVEKYYAEYDELPGSTPFSAYLVLHAAAEGMKRANSLDPNVWIPAVQGKSLTGLVTDGEYMFQDLTGRLLWPIVMMRGKSKKDMKDIFPSLPKVGPEWDKFEIVNTFDVDYQLSVVPKEALLAGTKIGGEGIGDGVMKYYK